MIRRPRKKRSYEDMLKTPTLLVQRTDDEVELTGNLQSIRRWQITREMEWICKEKE